MFDAIATVLAWFYDLVPSYGVAIALLTLSIMVVLTPLTLKGTRSMMAMQQLQPEMKKLQAKYKDDRQKLNEEMLKFYRENKINPLGGCLPLLIQAPVFLVLYRVLIGLTGSSPYGDALGGAVGCQAGGAGPECVDGVYRAAGTFDPSYLDEGSRLFQDLSGVREMMSFGIDLSESTQQALGQSFVHALPYLAMILAVTATSYIQQKQVSGRNPNAQVSPQQQMLLKLMPAFFAFISVTLPAGVVVYFLVSNLWRMAQQSFISRTMYHDQGGPITATAREADTSSTKAANGGPAPKGLLASLGLGAGPRPAKAPPAAKPQSAKAPPATPRQGKATAAGDGPSGNGAARSRPQGSGPRGAKAQSRAGNRAPQHRSKKKKKRK